MVVGADIAELLMKENSSLNSGGRPSSVVSSVGSENLDGGVSEASNLQNSEVINSSSNSILKEEIVTNKFREYLIHGSCKEALGKNSQFSHFNF